MFKRVVLIFSMLFVLSSNAKAVCDITSGVDIVTRTCWHCMLPITVASVPIMVGPMPDAAGPLTVSPICLCPLPPPIFVRPGIPISLYNPNTVAEVVKDPMCMPSLGLDLGSMIPMGLNRGTAAAKNQSSAMPRTFFQSHKVVFPVLYLLGVFLDTACLQQQDMDVAFITEPDPTFNDDVLATYLAPESILFGNPIAIASCVPDAISSTIFFTLDPLFWCKGSHGVAYPMTGSVQPKEFVEDAQSVAENMIYHTYRLGLGTTPGLCFKIPTPIWRKADFRFQFVKPFPHFIGMTVGQTGLMWTYGKNAPGIGDNFAILVFKKVNCCAL